MSLIRALAITAILATASMPAIAADPIAYQTSADTVAVPVADVPFDWNGFYGGVYGAGQFSPERGNQYGLGLDLGVNATFDFYLVGAEVAVQGLTSGSGETSYGQVLARGGVLVADDLALYATAGYGIDLGVPEQSNWLLGGGVEMAITDNVSLRAQYLHGFEAEGANQTNQVTIGANYHF
ncbi:outer membrane beta-barrel protein [Devosia sp. D6-9]|nr:outer membrane beta-barrel protein [Devosia sp. D6-9]